MTTLMDFCFRYNPQIEYQSHGSKLPSNQSLVTENYSNVTSGMASNVVSSSTYQILDTYSPRPMHFAQVQQDPNIYPSVVSESANFAAPNITLTKDLVQSMDANSNSLPYVQNPAYVNQTVNTANMKPDMSASAPQQYFQTFDSNSFVPNQETSQYFELQNAQPAIFTQAQPNANKLNAAPFIVDGSNSGIDMTQPSYYFAANPDHLQQDGNYPSGLTPLLVAQAQQPSQNQTDQENSQFQPQPLFLFSPAPTNSTKDKKEIDNRAQMVPLTPIQVLPASYVQSGLQNNGDNEIQYWFANGDQMVQGAGESNLICNAEFKSAPGITYHVANVVDNNVMFSQNDQPQSYFPSITPVAIMQPHGDVLSGWISTQPFQPSQPTIENKANSAVSIASTAEAQQTGELDISKNSASEDQPNVVMANSSGNRLPSFSASFISQLNNSGPKNTTVSQLAVAPIEKLDDKSQQISDQPSDPGEGASIANRNSRFSRDRLGATIESPFLVSVITPVAHMPATNEEANSVEKEDKNKSKSEQPETTLANESSIFRFPPTHISRRLAALRMQGITINTGPEANTTSAPVYVDSSSDSSKIQDGTSNESDLVSSKSGSLSSCGSVGHLPEEFLKGFSDVKSLPVLSIPSAGWSNDNISIRRGSISDAQLGQFVPSSTQQQLAASASVSAVCTSTSSGEQPQPLMPAPVKKKRKLAGDTSNYKTGQQRPFRFHIFTPSDFANGQVNVSQFRKPSVYAAKTNLGSPSAKRGRKVSKKSTTDLPILETVELEDEKEQPGGFQEKTSPKAVLNESKCETNAPASASTAMTIDASVTTTSVPVTMPPLKTPAELKNFSPQFTVCVPASDSTTVSSAVPMQLNTPVLLHSGALMTPGNFFYSLPSAKSSDKPSTPQIFNFMPSTKFPFYVSPSEPVNANKKSNSSESSDDAPTSTADTQQMKRSRMTLNLASRTSPDDTLQTPSKILVVTPSGAAANVKLTPDVPTFGFQPIDKTFPNEKSNASACDPDAKEKGTGNSCDFNTAPENLDNKTASTAAKKQLLPSIVVSMPPHSKSLEANEKMIATSQVIYLLVCKM